MYPSRPSDEIKHLQHQQNRVFQNLFRRFRQNPLEVGSLCWQNPQVYCWDQKSTLQSLFRHHHLSCAPEHFPLNPSASFFYQTKTLFKTQPSGYLHLLTYCNWDTLFPAPLTPPSLPRNTLFQEILTRYLQESALNLFLFYDQANLSEQWPSEGRFAQISYHFYRIEDCQGGFSLKGPSPSLCSLFDPETLPEKRVRLQNKLAQHPKLKVRGSYLLLEELSRELQIEKTLLKTLLEKLLPWEGIQLEEIREQILIKRSFYSC